MKLEDILKRVNALIELGDETLSTAKASDYGQFVDITRYSTFRSASLSFLARLFGETHSYYIEFNNEVQENVPYRVNAGIGILYAVRNEIEGGWLITFKSLVASEVFLDFLDMASYLLTQGYKDPAAVIIGSTLEGHLRQLCVKTKIPLDRTKPSGDHINKNAESMNVDLSKQGVYSVLDQKNVTFWLDLRNKAAHGKYDEYTNEQVKLMYQGVLDFTARIT